MALSTIHTKSGSWWESFAHSARDYWSFMVMSEWGKIGVTILCSVFGSVIGASFIVWNLLQDHESKLRILDVRMTTMKEYVDNTTRLREAKHDAIQQKLTEIQVDIGRIQGIRNGR